MVIGLKQLDFMNAEDLRDMGIQQAEENANTHVPGWSEIAFNLLREYLLSHRYEQFFAEEIRAYAASRGLDEPPSNRAFGAVILRAARAGLIKKVGIGPTTNPQAHCANAAIWRAA